MTKFLGLDQSKSRTGWALYERKSEPSTIICGSFSCSKLPSVEVVRKFSAELRSIIKRQTPDHIVFEQAKEFIFAHNNKVNAGQLILRDLQGAIISTCEGFGLPWYPVDSGSWRATMYPDGSGKMSKEDAKRYAAKFGETIGVQASNHDEYEAAFIAMYGPNHEWFKVKEYPSLGTASKRESKARATQYTMEGV